MTQGKLIREIKELKKIKPRQDWVLVTKKQILGEENTLELFPFLKLAYAGLFTLIFMFGLVEFSERALPGEPLYGFKKIFEQGQVLFSSEDAKPVVNLELANKRLKELKEIVQSNDTRKLAPAIDEFQTNVSRAAKNLTKVRKIDHDIVAQTVILEENKQKVEEILATKINIEEYDNAIADLVEREMADLEQRSLSEEQEIIFLELRQDFENGKYSEALIKILELSENGI